MSKRSDEKEHLARLLDAGEISQAVYEERMARMGHRGAAQQARKREENYASEPVRRGPKLHGTAPKEAVSYRLDIAVIAQLAEKAERAGLSLAGAVEAAIRAWRA